MTSPAHRAIAVAAELDRLNAVRARRQRLLLTQPVLFDQLGPVGLAAFLLDQAAIDARRRKLRELMANQLLTIPAAEAAVPPRVDPWTGPPSGRHHAGP